MTDEEQKRFERQWSWKWNVAMALNQLSWALLKADEAPASSEAHRLKAMEYLTKCDEDEPTLP